MSRRGGWGGGGGRWLIWTGRAVLWAVIVVIVVNGVRAPFERFTQANNPSTGAAAAPSDSGFPVTQASAFALQFAAVYLNFDEANADQRAERLRSFLPDGADPQFGWNRVGRMSAGAFQFAGIDVDRSDPSFARVKVTYQSGSRRGLLSVPVYHEGGRFVVAAQPALLPEPAPAGLPQVADPERDSAMEAELRPQVEGFFRAYASSNQVDLQRYVASGETIEGFGGAFTLAQLKDVVVPVGSDNTRQVKAVVVWAVPSGDPNAVASAGPDGLAADAGLEQAYQLTVEKQGGKWFVKQVQGPSRSVG